MTISILFTSSKAGSFAVESYEFCDTALGHLACLDSSRDWIISDKTPLSSAESCESHLSGFG